MPWRRPLSTIRVQVAGPRGDDLGELREPTFKAGWREELQDRRWGVGVVPEGVSNAVRHDDRGPLVGGNQLTIDVRADQGVRT